MQKHSLMSTKDWLLYEYLMLASNPGFSPTSEPFVSSYNPPWLCGILMSEQAWLLLFIQDIKFRMWYISIIEWNNYTTN